MIKICLKLQNMETKQMEVLAVFDEKNYDDTTKVYEKYIKKTDFMGYPFSLFIADIQL